MFKYQQVVIKLKRSTVDSRKYPQVYPRIDLKLLEVFTICIFCIHILKPVSQYLSRLQLIYKMRTSHGIFKFTSKLWALCMQIILNWIWEVQSSSLQNVFTTILQLDLNSTTKVFSNLAAQIAMVLSKVLGILESVDLNLLSHEKSISRGTKNITTSNKLVVKEGETFESQVIFGIKFYVGISGRTNGIKYRLDFFMNSECFWISKK